MKTKCIIGFCLVLAAINITACRKKSQPSQEQPTLQIESAPKPTAKQIQPDETEYFALFMEGKKIGYAIQDRIVNGSKVTTTIDLTITLNRAGVSVSVQMKADTFETIDGKPLGFELDQNFGLMVIKSTGTINDQGKLIVITGQEQM